MEHVRRVKLFCNGRNQAVRIPVEFELPGKVAIMRKEGDRLAIEAAEKKLSSLLAYLATLEPLTGDDRLPEIDDSDLLPLAEIDLGPADDAER